MEIFKKKNFVKKIAVLCFAFALTLGAGVLGFSNGKASEVNAEDPTYTLSFTKNTSASSYTNESVQESNNVKWKVYGNCSLGNYIRVGGKTSTATDRTLTSQSLLSTSNISRVVINHGGTGNGKDSKITVNSIKIEGSTNNDFKQSKSKTISSPSLSSAGALEFVPDDGLWDANSYFRITLNYQITGSNNCYLTINSVDFYAGNLNQLRTPTNISYSNGNLTWNTVEHATGYKVSVNGDTESLVNTNSKSIQLVTFDEVSIVATDSSGAYLDSSAGTYQYVNYGSESEPISVDDALQIAALHTNANVTELAYVKGKLTENPTNTTYGNFHISDDGTSSNSLYVYGVTATSTAVSKNGSYWSFSNPKDFGTNENTKNLKAQDEVIFKLRLYNYSGTMEGDGLFVKKYVVKTNINITGSDVSIKVGAEDVVPGDINVSGYTLTSANTEIASILNNKIHPVAEGDTTVTISKAEDESHTYTSKTINVTVSAATEPYITPDKTSVSGYTGTSEDVGASYGNLLSSFSVTSENTSIATVSIKSNSSGKVVLTIGYVGEGNTNILLKDGTNELATISVSVSLSTVTISGMPATSNVNLGKTLDLGSLITITPTGSCGSDVTWNSSDEGKATVNDNGVVTGVAAGITTITVTPNDYEAGTVSCVVNVSEVSGLISDGDYKIHHTRDNVTYYLVSNGTSAPKATTKVEEATIFHFTLVDENTYTIKDGDNYLYCIADNNGLRVGNTEFNWIIEDGESTLNGSFNIKQTSALKSGETARYIALYNNADFRCYTSATAGNRKENTDVTQILTLDNISISGAATQTSYLAGESFNPEGLTVTASYEASSTTVDVTDKVTWSPNPLTEGTTKVTATYTENDVTKTADYEGITVDSEPEDWAYNSLSLEASDEWKNEYFDGDELSLEGLSATANYTSASTGKEKHVLVENIEDVVFDFDSSTGGTKVLHGSYTIDGVTKTSTDNVEYTVTVVERYSKVTNIDEVLPGENIIFFNETAKKANAGLSEPNKDGVSYMLSVDALFENNKVIMNDDIKPLEIGRDSGYWTFGLDSQLLGANDVKSLCLDDGECTWTISIAEGVATISSTVSDYGAIYYNAGSPRFLNYTSTQAAVQLYKSNSIEAENALAFIKYFMAIDDATLVSTWSEVKAEFNKYSGIASYFEGDARSDGILVERMLAKYDNVVSMYNLEDFLQRDVEIHQYSITINDGISGERVETQPYNTDFTLPAAPEKHGFDFLGWSVNDEDPVKSGSVKVLGDMSVVAVWSQKTALHVTYNTNGGSQVVDQTDYYAGESVELLNAPIKDHYSFVGWNVNGLTKQPGETFVITEDTEVTALWCVNLGDVSVNTEANFRYSLNNDGSFREVTNTSLRIYLSLDKFSYEYLVGQGYEFTVGLTNYSKNPNSKATLTDLPVVYDEATDTYRFDIAINVPVENVGTSLGVQLIATKDGSDPILTTEANTSYTQAAKELYAAYCAGKVELTDNQVAALLTLISK